MATPADVADLAFLTAEAAAKILDIDAKTFRRLGVDYILVGNSKRYTVPGIRAWQERSIQTCPSSQREGPDGKQKRSQGRNTSLPGRGQRRSTTTSLSTVIDFARVAGLRTEQPPPILLTSATPRPGKR